MPVPQDLDPDAMTEKERLAKRRYQAWHAFEMNGPVTRRDHFYQGATEHLDKED